MDIAYGCALHAPRGPASCILLALCSLVPQAARAPQPASTRGTLPAAGQRTRFVPYSGILYVPHTPLPTSAHCSRPAAMLRTRLSPRSRVAHMTRAPRPTSCTQFTPHVGLVLSVLVPHAACVKRPRVPHVACVHRPQVPHEACAQQSPCQLPAASSHLISVANVRGSQPHP